MGTTAEVPSLNSDVSKCLEDEVDLTGLVFNNCRHHLRKVYEGISLQLNQELINQLAEDYQKNASVSENVFVSCVTTGLSNEDRKTVIDQVSKYFTDPKYSIPLAYIDGADCLCANNFFTQITTDLRYRSSYEKLQHCYSIPIKSEADVKKEISSIKFLKFAPLIELIGLFEEKNKTIIIIIGYAEKIESHVFGGIYGY